MKKSQLSSWTGRRWRVYIAPRYSRCAPFVMALSMVSSQAVCAMSAHHCADIVFTRKLCMSGVLFDTRKRSPSMKRQRERIHNQGYILTRWLHWLNVTTLSCLLTEQWRVPSPSEQASSKICRSTLQEPCDKDFCQNCCGAGIVVWRPPNLPSNPETSNV